MIQSVRKSPLCDKRGDISMAGTSDHFFHSDKIQQLVIMFACRIPVRRELSAPQRKALQNTLTDLSPEVFQLFDTQLDKTPGYLFYVLRQLPIEATAIVLPSFILENDAFSFVYPIKIAGKKVSGIGSIDASDANRKMLGWVAKVQEVIGNPHCQRAGKIYELLLGPFSRDDKKNLLNQLLSVNLDDVGELTLVFANYHSKGGEVYNIHTKLQYQQNRLEDIFFLNVRIDINNRNLVDTMEPREIERAWSFADSMIDSHLKDILSLD
jgi:hypothetical protein